MPRCIRRAGGPGGGGPRSMRFAPSRVGEDGRSRAARRGAGGGGRPPPLRIVEKVVTGSLATVWRQFVGDGRRQLLTVSGGSSRWQRACSRDRCGGASRRARGWRADDRGACQRAPGDLSAGACEACGGSSGEWVFDQRVATSDEAAERGFSATEPYHQRAIGWNDCCGSGESVRGLDHGPACLRARAGGVCGAGTD